MGHHASVEGRRSRSTGDGHGDPAPGPHDQAAEQHLERCTVLRVADQPGTEPVGRAVGGAGATHPDGGPARAAVILDEHESAGREHLEGGVHVGGPASTNRTVVPGPSNAGGSRSTSHTTDSVLPSSCQPPGEERG